MKHTYDWDATTSTGTYVLSDGENVFVGIATAAPEDQDFTNPYTGLYIAEQRATIKALQYRKNSILRPSLKALNQLYYSMKHSSNFNPKSYETKMLIRQINIAKDDLEATKELIKEIRTNLTTFINQKDALYKKLRKKRQAANQQITVDELLDETK